MENEQTETFDSPNEEVPVVTEETTDIETTEVDVEQLQATNKKLYERAKRAEAKLLREKPKQVLPEQATDVSSVYEQVALLKDIERDEMDSLEEDVKELKIPMLSYLKSTAGKTRLEAIRKEKKSKEASPAIGNSSPVFKKHTQADLAKMSVAELEKILPHAE